MDKAVQLLLQASSAQPQDPTVWFTLATALARKVCSATRLQPFLPSSGFFNLHLHTMKPQTWDQKTMQLRQLL